MKKFFIIFKNRKKFFDKNENYQLDDAASEKASKTGFRTSMGSQIRILYHGVRSAVDDDQNISINDYQNIIHTEQSQLGSL